MAEADALSALQAYARQLTAKFRTLGDAQPEDQLKGPVDGLLTALGAQTGQQVSINTERRVEEIGRPDMAVATRGLLSGFVELKAPGAGADVRRFRDRNKRQWQKFKSLPNLIYTDGNDWALYRDGEAVQHVTLPGDVTVDNGAELDQQDAAALLRLLRDFLAWQPIVPISPRRLAELLAPLCHLLRDDVREALRDPDSALSALAVEWRSYLFPEAGDDQFADAYAQTLTYALLLAKLSGANLTTRDRAEDAPRARHRLLAQVLSILAQSDARQEIVLGVDLLERTIAAVDPAALSRGGADPWLYFYEDFLAAYDPALRNQRGVYYTPVEVVKAQVNLVADVLQRRLGKPLAYADKGVLLLDPAAGTGAYPLTALQFGLDRVEAVYGSGERGAAASLMAQNIHAFELLVGPYAVAHLRLSERVLDAGGVLPSDGAHVYLTDTLESPHAAPPGQLPLQARALVDKHQRALNVKRDAPILVCIGNPPYDREQRQLDDEGGRRKGSWVRFGEPGESGEQALLADFLRPARSSGAGVHLKNLYNDYVYFWRWALWKVLESKPGPGVVSFITASSYLRGPGFVGMREVMRRNFDELWIIDLEGDGRGARRTENVIDIQTPVAIAIGVRYGAGDPNMPADVWYARIEGTPAAKLAALNDLTALNDLHWSSCLSDWHDPFVPVGTGDYFSWPLLTDLFPWQHSGVQVKRSWPIAETKEVLQTRWRSLLSSSDRRQAFKETPDRRIIKRYRSVTALSEPLPPIASEGKATDPLDLAPYAYRSFDRRWLIADGRLIDRPRPPLWVSYSDQQIFLTSLLTKPLGGGPALIITAHVPDLDHFSNRGGKDVIPLWRDAEAIKPNLTEGLIDRLTTNFGEPVAPVDVFTYAYGVMGGTAYVEHFSDELTIPGPRLPVTKDLALFRRAAALGRELAALHTYGARFTDALTDGRMPSGQARSLVGIPSTHEGYPEVFTYDASRQELHVGSGRIGPVHPAIWEYSISGFRVVRSWLGYRMRSRAGRASSRLDEIRPERWTLAMTKELFELLWVLEATIAREPKLRALLVDVVQGPLFTAADLNEPAAHERHAPAVERSTGNVMQAGLALDL